MGKQTIILDTKLFKRIQSQVNRRLSESSTSISLGSVREFIVQNHTDMYESDIPGIVDELVDICLGAQSKAMSLYQPEELATEQNDSQTSSLSLPTANSVPSTASGSMVPTQYSMPQQSQLNTVSSIDHTQICLAVQEQFANESQQMQLELIKYAEEQAFSSLLQLRQGLAELRKFRTDVLRKLIADHNQASNDELHQLRSALQLGQSARQTQAVEETNAFLASLADKRAVFGL